MYSPTLHSATRRSIAIAICCALIVLFIGTPSFAQQTAYIVPAQDGSLNFFDLATSNLIKSFIPDLASNSAAVGSNPRLAFAASGANVSVLDLTIGKEIRRARSIYVSSYSAPVFTPDGKQLLFADDYNYTLDIFDVTNLRTVREVRLGPAMGSGIYSVGSVVVVGQKAYVTTEFPDEGRPAIAVVDLRTFRVRPITIPSGFFEAEGLGTLPNAAATPDGQYVVMTESSLDGLTNYLLYISTSSDRVVAQYTVPNFYPYGLVINPQSSSGYGYVLAYDSVGGYLSVTALDLASGQLQLNTEVAINQFFDPSGLAISADGSMLVVTSYDRASPNALVISTSLMLTDPAHAIVGQATVSGGILTHGVTIAPVQTTPPGTAPTVTGVSGSVTNDAPATIHVFGTNFLAGAQVRIGGMNPLLGTVNSPTDLQVTIPQNAPAAPNLDVLVTNPQTSSPPAQQYQSGLLPGGMTINVNPAFQPQHEFASLNTSDGSFSFFDFNQRAMVRVPLNLAGRGGVTFNLQGTDLYTAHNPARAVALDLSTLAETDIAVSGSRVGSYTSVAPSVNPATGGSIVYEWTEQYSGTYDLVVNMIDSNPASPTFNTVIEILNAGLNSSDFPFPYAGTATPDGKYVYVDYLDADTGQYAIAIFDVVNGGPATIISTSSLGIGDPQFLMQVTSDGKSLLANGGFSLGSANPIVVLDIGTNPKNPTLVTRITGTPLSGRVGGPGPMFLYSYQVVGNRLFAMDFNNNLLVAFNFDRQHSNFSQLGAYQWNGDFAFNPYIAVSPDGALLYMPFGGDDLISVFDANLLASGQPPLITNLASFHGASYMAVSPVAHSSKLPLHTPDSELPPIAHHPLNQRAQSVDGVGRARESR